MIHKLLIATVLVVFSGVQIANALECYQCNTHESCAQTTLPKANCTIENAYETAKSISRYYQYVRNTTSENFYCLTMNLTQGTSMNSIFEIKGCIFHETNACALPVKNSIDTPFSSACVYCNKNLCNGYGKGNSAGAYSSSVFTMFAAVLSVLLAKRLIY